MVHRFVKLGYPGREIPSRTSWWNPLFDCKVEVKPVTWLQNVTIIPSRSHLFVRWSQSCSNCYFWSTQLQKVVPPGICWFTNPIKYRYMHHKPIVWIRCVASMSCKTYWCVVGNGGMRWLLICTIPYQAPETRSPESQVIGETEELSKRIVQSFSELTRT